MTSASAQLHGEPAGSSADLWKILAVSATAALMAFLDTTVVTIAFPQLEASFGEASRSELSWVLVGYSTVFVALLVPAGRYADVFGPRRLFLGGVAGFILASAACAVAWSPAALIAARVVQAASGALLIPASLALLLAAFPPHQRATAVGLWGAAAAIAAALGPAVGGLLTSVGSWRLVFLVNLPIGVAALAYGRRLLPTATPASNARRPDVSGSLLIAGSVAAIALGLIQSPTWGWGDARTWTALAVGAALAPVALLRASGQELPAVDLKLFRIRSFALANLGTWLFGVGLYGVLFSNVLFLTGTWRYSVLRAGFATMPAPVVAALVSAFAGRRAERSGFRGIIMVGGLAFAAGNGWLWFTANATPAFASVWLPGAVVLGLGIGLASPALASAAVSAVPPERFAEGSGVNAMMRQMGLVVGVAVVVTIIGTPSGADEAVRAFHNAWLVVAVCGVACAVPSFWLTARPAVSSAAPVEPIEAR